MSLDYSVAVMEMRSPAIPLVRVGSKPSRSHTGRKSTSRAVASSSIFQVAGARNGVFDTRKHAGFEGQDMVVVQGGLQWFQL